MFLSYGIGHPINFKIFWQFFFKNLVRQKNLVMQMCQIPNASFVLINVVTSLLTLMDSVFLTDDSCEKRQIDLIIRLLSLAPARISYIEPRCQRVFTVEHLIPFDFDFHLHSRSCSSSQDRRTIEAACSFARWSTSQVNIPCNIAQHRLDTHYRYLFGRKND